jgi:hypothetical protein
VLSVHGDYLLAIYPGDNVNNVNASPNKIYDAIHTRTPLIMNRGIGVAETVSALGIGYVFEHGQDIDYRGLSETLYENRHGYRFSDALIAESCWENYEERLLSLHR